MCFAPHERKFLTAQPGIGPVVVLRLEQAGFDSIASLRRAGAPAVIRTVCAVVGEAGWLGRRRALERALRAVEAGKHACA